MTDRIQAVQDVLLRVSNEWVEAFEALSDADKAGPVGNAMQAEMQCIEAAGLALKNAMPASSAERDND